MESGNEKRIQRVVKMLKKESKNIKNKNKKRHEQSWDACVGSLEIKPVNKRNMMNRRRWTEESS